MQKWEYFVATGNVVTMEVGSENQRTLDELVPLPKYLDEMGDSWWELVSVTRVSGGDIAVLIFKRPKK